MFPLHSLTARFLRHRSTIYLVALILVVIHLSAVAQTNPSVAQDDVALSAATQELCPVRIAMLGESATHGDGHTIAFKVALVKRLVDRCGFDSVFFEANQEEFLHLNRRLRLRESVTSDDVLSAIGGLWKFYREFQPLAAFLLQRAESGRVFLGGIDDQLGQLGQDYANVSMIAEWARLLPVSEGETCTGALHRRIYSEYSDAAPYSTTDRLQISACLSDIQKASDQDATTDRETKEERREMVSATRRWIGRDFSSDAERTVDRDRSMFATFEWLQGRLRKQHKVIVWAATVHVARQADPSWGDRTGLNFGRLVHQRYGEQAYALGFSALGGSYRQGKGNVPLMPSAPLDSVESLACHDPQPLTGYLGRTQLAALGTLPGAFFRHSYQTLLWSNFLDGVVVFQSEYPPDDVRASIP